MLAARDVLLMSDISGRSFDGRYFGPIERAQIQAVIRPVWIWK
jgi:type IV secretory pathway protease TraF